MWRVLVAGAVVGGGWWGVGRVLGDPKRPATPHHPPLPSPSPPPPSRSSSLLKMRSWSEYVRCPACPVYYRLPTDN
jgi:hypothetical protein